MNDDLYDERIAKVRSTQLGIEDHGVLSAYLHMDFGGHGQGFGGYFLDDNDDGHRVGTAAGMDWLLRTINVFGCDWEQIAGKSCLVLYEKDAGVIGHLPVGLKPLPFEKGEPFVIADWRARWFPEEAT